MRVEALGKMWVAANASTVFAGMLEAMVRDGPRVTLAALLGVTVLVLFCFGWRGAVPVLLSLAIGMLWLCGLLAAIGLKLNFVNFVGVPITLGVGADYAANVWARIRAEPGVELKEVIADTGSAVALCSVTTIIGYGSLLLASNRALQSFGKLAMIGEITCLLAALMALPAMIQLLRRRARA
jgi:predicted RND superfamily exporter protein